MSKSIIIVFLLDSVFIKDIFNMKRTPAEFTVARHFQSSFTHKITNFYYIPSSFHVSSLILFDKVE